MRKRRPFIRACHATHDTEWLTEVLPEIRIMDIVYVAAIVAFFAATWGLVRFCAALMREGEAK